jgi:hypothetical protein
MRKWVWQYINSETIYLSLIDFFQINSYRIISNLIGERRLYFNEFNFICMFFRFMLSPDQCNVLFVNPISELRGWQIFYLALKDLNKACYEPCRAPYLHVNRIAARTHICLVKFGDFVFLCMAETFTCIKLSLEKMYAYLLSKWKYYED